MRGSNAYTERILALPPRGCTHYQVARFTQHHGKGVLLYSNKGSYIKLGVHNLCPTAAWLGLHKLGVHSLCPTAAWLGLGNSPSSSHDLFCHFWQ